MTGWQSPADAAVLGLVAAANEVAGVEVHDSLLLTKSDAEQVLVVAGGIDSSNMIDRAYIDHQLQEPGYDDQSEQFVIWSTVAVVAGDTQIPAARTRCYDIAREFGQAIYADPTLGDAVLLAYVSQMSWLPQQPTGGALALLLVGVTCQAITNI